MPRISGVVSEGWMHIDFFVTSDKIYNSLHDPDPMLGKWSIECADPAKANYIVAFSRNVAFDAFRMFKAFHDRH